jgi:hypothetical protein
MFYFLFRLLGALVAAAVAIFGVSIVAVSAGVPAKEQAGWMVLTMLAAALVAFVWMFRRLGSGRWRQRHVEAQIGKLRRQAVRRNIGPQATLVATVLGGGSYATATLRASWNGDAASVDATEGGAWRTVFSGRFHPEVAGQVVPGGIRPNPIEYKSKRRDRFLISTRRVGHEPAWWEVLAYAPGDWEEELSRLWEAAKQAKHEGEKARFGIE